MSENHYWKHPNGTLAITTKENVTPDESWTEITYEEYLAILHPVLPNVSETGVE